MKNNTNRKGFYIRLNDEENHVVKLLKTDYAINISGAFKVFLKQYLSHLENLDVFNNKEYKK